MDWPSPTLADVLKARRSIAPYLPVTPSLEPPGLALALGCRAVLKCENLNPTGAFKVRGGVNLVAALDPDVRVLEGSWRPRRATTANRLPTRRGCSAARRRSSCPKPPTRSRRRRPWPWAPRSSRPVAISISARLAAEEYAARHLARYVHSANEPLLVAGVGTAALELLEAAPDLDVLFVPVGGGSGVLGAGIVARAVNPAIRVVGVQAEGAPAVYRSWREGRRVVTDSVNTFAEGLATREPFAMPLALFPRLVDEMVLGQR